MNTQDDLLKKHVLMENVRADELAVLINSVIEDDFSDYRQTDTLCRSDDGNLSVFYSIQAQQLRSFYKKYVFTSVDQEVLDVKAKRDFVARNDALAAFDFCLPPASDPILNWKEYEARDRILFRARTFISSVLGPVWLEDVFKKCRHSTGTTIGVKHSDTSLEAKLAWPGTYCGREIEQYISSYLAWDVTYAEALLQSVKGRLRVEGGKRFLSKKKKIVKKVLGSKLSTVEKDATKRRCIAPEPTWNMMFQLGLMDEFVERFDDAGLSMDSAQLLHGDLAFVGSINPDVWATIDFANASDSVATELVRWLLPADWFLLVNAFRTPFTSYKDGKYEVNVELAMVGTMGSATTFPIETLIFWAISSACVQEHFNPATSVVDRNASDLCRVFGDDVILPTPVAELFMSVCRSVGFHVNQEKSHYMVDDYYRESCGADYFRGRAVRPYFLGRPNYDDCQIDSDFAAANEAWFYVIVNRLQVVYKTAGYSYSEFLTKTSLFSFISFLFGSHDFLFKCVPSDYPEDSGFTCSNPEKVLNLVSSRLKMSPIAQDEHGSLYFTFLVYKKRGQHKTYQRIRYWASLKTLPESFFNLSIHGKAYQVRLKHNSWAAKNGETSYTVSRDDVVSPRSGKGTPIWVKNKKSGGFYEEASGIMPYF